MKQILLRAPGWFLYFLASLALLSACSHLTVAPKPVNATSIAFDENVQNAGIIDCDARGCLVTPNWLAKYKQMEGAVKNTIVADANIKADGNNYRVSYEVFNHFAELKASERGP
jgi:hypothetical protein